jgi:acetyltransferase
VESFGELGRFKAVARRVARAKPIVALVGGRTAPGVGAVRRHTGGDAIEDAGLDALLVQCGILRVASLRSLLVACKGLGGFPQGIGRRILLLSNSGGPGVLTTDSAVRAGLEMPELPQALAERLRAMLPGEAAVANPLDLLADAREDRFGETLRLALEHGRGTFDAILMLHVVPFMVDASPVVARLAGMARDAGVPFMHSMMGTLPGKKDWFAMLEAAGVPAFDDAEEMAAAAGIAARYGEIRRKLAG